MRPKHRGPSAKLPADMKRPAALPAVGFAASRRAVLTTTLFGLATTLPTAHPPLAAAAGKGTEVYSIISAALDRRSYRGLILANGLRVLLASDPDAAKGAASMDVQVGYMSDPSALPGLAHFCEHMLFLGTKPFPNEGDFEQYVGAAGGSNNAYTAAEETNYFFDVQGSALPKALERFAAFFTAPLFTPSATAREVSAIESEHTKNLQSDFWRYEQLFKLRADQTHPYAKFGTGNRQTLRDGEDATRDALLRFHERYYQAEQMSLSVIGPQSLDTLQSLVLKNFDAVPMTRPALPSSSSAYDGLPLPFNPASQPPIATLMVPVNEMRSLKLVWCLPVLDLDNWINSKPEEIWSLLVRNRGAGGLLPLLKRKGLANSLDANVEEFTRSFIILSVGIDLTPLGLTKWRAVCSMLFAYLRTLAGAGIPPYLVSEYSTMADTSFRYAEPTKPGDFATSSSGNLPFYPPSKWVSGPPTIQPGSESGTKYMLDWCANPRNSLITLVAKNVEDQATMTEPIYGTKYGTISLAREMEAWASSNVPAGLAPPLPNPFIPTDFAIKCGGGGLTCVRPERGDVAPKILTSRPGLTVHFLQDATFKRPKAFAYLLFRSPLLYTSPQASITSQLFQTVLADTLQDSTYQAGLAGLGAGVGAEYNGLYLTASGYNSRLPELIEYVATQAKSAELAPLVFDRSREALRQSLANFDRRQPVGLASYYRSLGLESPRYSIEQLRAAVETASLADVRAFQAALLPECLLEALLVGNLDETQAEAIVAKTTAALPASGPLEPSRIPRRQVRVLPIGRTLRQFVAPNPEERNSATELYVQVGKDEGDAWLLLAVLSQLLEQPFYGELRTKQQLGYIVQSAVTDSEGVRALVFSVQSAVLAPPEVEQRIETFLSSYRATLAALPEAELATVREALASASTDVDQRLAEQAGRLWREIVMRRYDYGRPWRNSKRFRGVTKAQLLAFFDEYIAVEGGRSRRLVTHVFARANAPTTLSVGVVDDEFYPPSTDLFSAPQVV